MGYTTADAGFHTSDNGSNIYFCTASNTLVTATIAMGYTEYDTNGLDYTIFVFTQDLPPGIRPMAIPTNYVLPTSYSVVFNTCQSGHMSANQPPFANPLTEGADPDAFPPFNIYPTHVSGDSGSPLMLPETDDVLVFLGGDTTSAACSQMQTDMNILSVWAGLSTNNYQMVQHSVQ
jgi:hypothetical protein